jgi:glutamate-ammonia-ligase adenylyltransferase
MTRSAITPHDGPAHSAAALSRQGFANSDAAQSALRALGLWDDVNSRAVDGGAASVVSALGRAADPDLALTGLAAIGAAQPSEAAAGVWGAARASDAALRRGLIAVLGASRALADHLVANPHDWRLLRAAPVADAVANVDLSTARQRILSAVGATDDDPVTGTGGRRALCTGDRAVALLTLAYRRELLRIAAADLSASDSVDLEQTMAELADLAGATVQAALAVAAAGLPAEAATTRLAVIAMGKTGGRELNYVSDVDVVFVAEGVAGPGGQRDDQPALAVATTLAAQTMQLCARIAWQVDAALRPEGKGGPLVRTLASHEAYYRRWASTWEFQALLKARPIAGDGELGARYQDMIAPLVWAAAERPNFVADVQAMRRRVVSHLSRDIAEREIKLGPGGLRDVEFAVQLLQLVHGRMDERLRSGATLPALAALRDGGYVGRDDAVSLVDAYRFLRAVEHRLQLLRLRRTHLVPSDEPSVQWLARAMGFRPDKRGDAAAVFAAEWSLHAREVRRLHEKLFYRPLLEAVARVPSSDLRLSPEQAGARMAALGFADPSGALGHLAALTSGVSRRAAIQRTLLPVLLAELSEAPDPDAGLLSYRRVSEALEETPWYLRLLRDGGLVAHRLAYLLGTSKYVTDLLGRAPEALALLADDAELAMRTRDELDATMADVAQRHPDAKEAIRAVRGVRRHELLRISCADLLGLRGVLEVSRALSALTDATLRAALDVAVRAVGQQTSLHSSPAAVAIIAMGRLGGNEVSYGSDADVMFVYEPAEGVEEAMAARYARDVVELLWSLLGAPDTDPPLALDANLRPEGRGGPLVRSLSSYRQYYQRWSSVWESQALLRARGCAGDTDLTARFLKQIEAIRYPAEGLTAEQVTEIRRIKARVDAERLPRGADTATHTKLGRGGLADVEWTIQLIQLQHAGAIAGLRTTSTLDALHAALEAELISGQDAAALEGAWTFSTRVRNAIMLVNDKPNDQLPTSGRALTAVGRALGYPVGFDSGQLDDDYRRATRRARKSVETLFYG